MSKMITLITERQKMNHYAQVNDTKREMDRSLGDSDRKK